MKKILFAIIFFCLGLSVPAQKVYFIYLQSEKQVPFFVKIAEQVHSSSSIGYLILSSLKDSTYVFLIGYPGTRSTEAKFSITIQNKDRGFLIKDLAEGPRLFDLQTLTLYSPLASVSSTNAYPVRTDSFTQLLALATDDQSLLTIPTAVAKKEAEILKEKQINAEIKPEAVAEVPSEIPSDTNVGTSINTETASPKSFAADTQDQQEVKIREAWDTTKGSDQPTVAKIEGLVDSTALINQAPAEIKSQESDTAIQEGPYLRSVIVRHSESSTTEGFGLVFLDNERGIVDTIRLLIPNQKKLFREEVMTEPQQIEVLELSLPETSAAEHTVRVSIVKPLACTAFANDKDFLKARKNMAAESNDEQMITVAKKYFKSKCFTTEQIRNLSVLFLTSAAKYQFFSAAYAHVADQAKFPLLGDEIKDEYYSMRFKALIREQ